MQFRSFGVICAVCLVCATPAAAQSVRLEFHNGRVNLSAQNAPVRTILAEWARLGGTKIVNGDRVTGAPVTLELVNTPERQAVEIILRNVSGFMLGSRQDVSASLSAFDRILILPTSTPSTAVSAPPPAASPRPAFAPPFPSPFVGQTANDPNQDDDVESDGNRRVLRPRTADPRRPDEPPEFVPPRNNLPPAVIQAFPPGVQVQPDDQPQAAPQTPANNPFGVVPGSARPGVISPVPQAQPRNRPQDDSEP